MQVINIFLLISFIQIDEYSWYNVSLHEKPCFNDFFQKTKPVNVLRQQVQESEFEIISLLVALFFLKNSSAFLKNI